MHSDMYYFCLSVVQGRAYGSVDGMLTEEVFDECVEEMVEQHRQKVTWEK